MREYEYDKRTCVEAVRRFIDEHASTNSNLYKSLRLRPSFNAIVNHVGSWTEAVRLAGGIPYRSLQRSELIKQFRRSIAMHGRIPTTFEYMKLGLRPTFKTLVVHGISYEEAMELIGLKYYPHPNMTKKGKRQCPMCGMHFTPGNGKQIYCLPKCRDRFKQWKYRVLREMNQKCPQCGGDLIEPERTHKGKPKHCARCQLYYRNKTTPPSQ